MPRKTAVRPAPEAGHKPVKLVLTSLDHEDLRDAAWHARESMSAFARRAVVEAARARLRQEGQAPREE